MGGFVVVNDAELARRVAFIQNAEGTALAPFDCWLFLRGIKTMAIRMERAQANASAVVRFLQRHMLVRSVFFPGLADHRAGGYVPEGSDAEELAAVTRSLRAFELHASQASGAGAVVSFTTGSVTVSSRLCDALRIFKTTVSFGSCNSLCARLPARMLPLPCPRLHQRLHGLPTAAAESPRLSFGRPTHRA
jgi:cystathionine beta-lyase